MLFPALHIGHRLAWDAWHLEPTVVSGAFIIVSFYTYFNLRQPGGFNWARAAVFYLGSLALFVALVSPLDTAADKLLSMHMLQHVVLTTIGPPLVLLGLTPGMLQPLLTPGIVNRVARFVVNPLFTAPLFIVNMWVWHVPLIYEEALVNVPVHASMHIAFMATGILFWWPVIQPLPQLSRLPNGGRLLYLFVTGMPMGVLALLLIAAGSVIYSHYETADPTWGLKPIEDQQIAGMIMGALGEFATFVAITYLFFRYLDRDGQEEEPPGPVEPGPSASSATTGPDALPALHLEGPELRAGNPRSAER